jgi:predicted 3-demethylubiquinone-9 3-methyltransferase (glyoxalase superfamily)
VSWQIIPAVLVDLMADPDARKTERVMNALLKMKRLDISTLQRAFEET